MAEVSKLRIHERSNVERPNLLVLVTKIGNKNWENWFVSNSKYKNWPNENTNNSKIANSWSRILGFQIEKILEVFDSSDLNNSKKSHSEKFQELPIWTISKMIYLEDSKNFQFGTFQKCLHSKFSKISNSGIPKN